MQLAPAPFFDDVAGGPAGGTAWWATASDEVRIRVGLWPVKGARGTVLLFPGRTEYIEKYGATAAELAARGLSTLAIDWRGQGLSDRLLDNTRIGHVEKFTDYQRDIAAMLRAARELDLPRPFYLLAHSMGGCIGLRAVMEGLPVQACAFTGPMWGIHMSPVMRPIGWGMAMAGAALGFGDKLTPNTTGEGYVMTQGFDGNALTNDPDMYQMMRDQLTAHPDLGIGGPSLRWLREALLETRHLASRASPDLSCLTFLGTQEAIIDSDTVRARMKIWPRGTLDVVETAQHEVLMDTPAIRNHVFDRLAALFSSSRENAKAD
ncbi:MAG: lysophospholipase [Paracoccaceae bacterium]|jgi:lysophospholipase